MLIEISKRFILISNKRCILISNKRCILISNKRCILISNKRCILISNKRCILISNKSQIHFTHASPTHYTETPSKPKETWSTVPTCHSRNLPMSTHAKCESYSSDLSLKTFWSSSCAKPSLFSIILLWAEGSCLWETDLDWPCSRLSGSRKLGCRLPSSRNPWCIGQVGWKFPPATQSHRFFSERKHRLKISKPVEWWFHSEAFLPGYYRYTPPSLAYSNEPLSSKCTEMS